MRGKQPHESELSCVDRRWLHKEPTALFTFIYVYSKESNAAWDGNSAWRKWETLGENKQYYKRSRMGERSDLNQKRRAVHTDRRHFAAWWPNICPAVLCFIMAPFPGRNTRTPAHDKKCAHLPLYTTPHLKGGLERRGGRAVPAEWHVTRWQRCESEIGGWGEEGATLRERGTRPWQAIKDMQRKKKLRA